MGSNCLNRRTLLRGAESSGTSVISRRWDNAVVIEKRLNDMVSTPDPIHRIGSDKLCETLPNRQYSLAALNARPAQAAGLL